MHTAQAQLGEDGGLVIPASLRQEMGLRPGDTIVIEFDGDSLLLHNSDWPSQESS